MNIIGHKELKEILDYNPDTGIFTWKKSKIMSTNAVAGYINHQKYVVISISGKKHQAHRLAWLYVYGKFPNMFIDHINGDRADNRIDNLRDVSNRVNGCNRKIHREGKLPGCTFLKSSNKWQAQIKQNNVYKYLGCFDSQMEAHQVYMEERKALVGGWKNNKTKKENER